MTIQYFTFRFVCEGINSAGRISTIEQEFIHQDEEQARRELIHTLNHLYGFRPRKLSLKQTEIWEPSPFFFN